MDAQPDSQVAPKPTAGRWPPFTGHKTRFIRRTITATLITLGLVALTAGVYWSLAWAGWYLFAGVWSLVFFALTPLILKAFLSDGRPFLGLGLVGLKLLWLGLMYGAGNLAIGSGLSGVLVAGAFFGGVTTPLVVVVLRVLGAYSTAGKREGPRRSRAVRPTPQVGAKS